MVQGAAVAVGLSPPQTSRSKLLGPPQLVVPRSARPKLPPVPGWQATNIQGLKPQQRNARGTEPLKGRSQPLGWYTMAGPNGFRIGLEELWL